MQDRAVHHDRILPNVYATGSRMQVSILIKVDPITQFDVICKE